MPFYYTLDSGCLSPTRQKNSKNLFLFNKSAGYARPCIDKHTLGTLKIICQNFNALLPVCARNDTYTMHKISIIPVKGAFKYCGTFRQLSQIDLFFVYLKIYRKGKLAAG